MINLLFIILFIIIFVKYNANNNLASPYILSPDIVVLSVFSLSVFVTCLNVSEWGDISILTFLVILSSLILFCLGASIKSKKIVKINRNFPQQTISTSITITVILFMLFVTYLDYIDVVKFVGKSGLGIMALSVMARDNFYADKEMIQHSSFVLQGIYASRALAYIYMYVICYNKFLKKESYSILYYIPLSLYFIQIVLSTGRSEFIYFFYGFFVLGYILQKTRVGWGKRNDKMYLKYLLGGSFLFFSIFSYIASLRNEGESDIIETIGHYVASSLPAFDQYLEKNGIEANSTFWGEQTQVLYYSILNSLGVSSEKPVYTMEPITLKNGDYTNIYTCLCRYIHDYGLLGCLFILFFLGFLYSKMFYSLKNSCAYDYKLIWYSFLSYPLTEFAIEERFFSNMLAARSFYICFYIWLFYKLLLNKFNATRNL